MRKKSIFQVVWIVCNVIRKRLFIFEVTKKAYPIGWVIHFIAQRIKCKSEMHPQDFEDLIAL